MASKPGTLSPEQILSDYGTIAKATKTKNTLSYTGARGWFVLDGENVRGNEVIEAGQAIIKKTPAAVFNKAGVDVKSLFVKPVKEKRGPGRPPGSVTTAKAKPAATKAPSKVTVKGKAKAKPAAKGHPLGSVKTAKNGKGPVVNPNAGKPAKSGKRQEVTVKLAANDAEVLEHVGGGDIERGIGVLAGYYRKTVEQIARKAMGNLLEQEG